MIRLAMTLKSFSADDPGDWDELFREARIFDEAGLPYLLVQIDAAWRLPWDRHPNARAAHAIAAAVAARLQEQ